jgi:cell division septal protein FtsQ
MKLKRQPPSQPRPARAAGRTVRASARAGARPKGRMARRPGVPMRRRFSGRLPSIRRIIAGLAAAAAVAGLAALLNGPWLRVTGVEWTGLRYTAAEAVAAVLEPQTGGSVLEVDTAALRVRLERLPSVSEATVTASLTGTVEASVVERAVAFVWETTGGQFLMAEDGTVFASYATDEPLPDALDSVPRVMDGRFVARLVTVGDQIPPALLEPTRDILAIDPAALGSDTDDVAVRLDDEYGFRLVSSDPDWEVALGVYGLNPRESAAEASARLERQVTAVRTLFASHSERGIGWVDVRNPGKVYFRGGG